MKREVDVINDCPSVSNEEFSLTIRRGLSIKLLFISAKASLGITSKNDIEYKTLMENIAEYIPHSFGLTLFRTNVKRVRNVFICSNLLIAVWDQSTE